MTYCIRLEHEALPKKDYKQIRNKAPELVKLGKAIVAVGVPAGTKDEQKHEFAKELKKFDKALAKFRTDAKRDPTSNSRRRIAPFMIRLKCSPACCREDKPTWRPND